MYYEANQKSTSPINTISPTPITIYGELPQTVAMKKMMEKTGDTMPIIEDKTLFKEPAQDVKIIRQTQFTKQAAKQMQIEAEMKKLNEEKA